MIAVTRSISTRLQHCRRVSVAGAYVDVARLPFEVAGIEHIDLRELVPGGGQYIFRIIPPFRRSSFKANHICRGRFGEVNCLLPIYQAADTSFRARILKTGNTLPILSILRWYSGSFV